MSTVAEIKAAIPSLTLAEREDVARFLHEFTDDVWDRQMAADAEPGGKLHRLMERAEAETGTWRDFPGREQE